MKLGGMMMRLAAFDYRTAAEAAHLDRAGRALAPVHRDGIELLRRRAGASFESNFPVDKMGIGWAALWNAFKRIAAGASAAEKQAMFSGTARRVYRLDGRLDQYREANRALWDAWTRINLRVRDVRRRGVRGRARPGPRPDRAGRTGR